MPADNNLVHDMAPVKSEVRTLPITEKTQIYFERQLEMQNFKKKMHSSMEYFENDLVVSKPDGSPLRRKALSAAWTHFIEHAGMRHNRFHDLRHAAATNIYQLSGDFYCVGQILGHSLKGVGLQLNISSNFDAVTATYIDVRVERKREVLDIYHNTLHNQWNENVVAKLKKKIILFMAFYIALQVLWHHFGTILPYTSKKNERYFPNL